MNKTNIGWTDKSWNPAHGCSKVSPGCSHCYAESLSLRFGLTKREWTTGNAAANVDLKAHKLAEPFGLKPGESVFVNSMSDMFHELIPDWYRAAIWAVMAACPENIFQVLTKRAEALPNWGAALERGLKDENYKRLSHKDRRVAAALQAFQNDPVAWPDNVWMGVSVESAKFLPRIDRLRECGAALRFISAEPLFGSLAGADLEGIGWVIAGGESGAHLRGPEDARWLKMHHARELRDMCAAQGVAFFFKQDSAARPGQRSFIVEADGSETVIQQIPKRSE